MPTDHNNGGALDLGNGKMSNDVDPDHRQNLNNPRPELPPMSKDKANPLNTNPLFNQLIQDDGKLAKLNGKDVLPG